MALEFGVTEVWFVACVVVDRPRSGGRPHRGRRRVAADAFGRHRRRGSTAGRRARNASGSKSCRHQGFTMIFLVAWLVPGYKDVDLDSGVGADGRQTGDGRQHRVLVRPFHARHAAADADAPHLDRPVPRDPLPSQVSSTSPPLETFFPEFSFFFSKSSLDLSTSTGHMVFLSIVYIFPMKYIHNR